MSEAGILHVSEPFNTSSPNSVFLFQLMATPEVMTKMKVYAKDVKGGMRMTAKISKTLGLVVITAGGGTTSCVLASVRSLKNIGAVLIVRSNRLHCLPKLPLLHISYIHIHAIMPFVPF